MRFKVRAPASSANLGPGFDALGLALDLWNELTISTDGAAGEITVSGSGAHLLKGDSNNYSLSAMRDLAIAYGRQLPPFSMEVKAEVPVSRGLGSSAAALAAGLLAADRLLGLNLSRADIYGHAWGMEGHGDNVGAAIYGGAILAVSGLPEAISLGDGPSLGLVAVVFIPEATSATWAARAALPATVPLPDAAFNVGTCAGLSVGLATRNHAAISAGMHDRLHEPYRSRLFPHLTPMSEAARSAGALGACLSGAGPTILALAEPDKAPAVEAAYLRVAREHGFVGTVTTMLPTSHGAHIVDEK